MPKAILSLYEFNLYIKDIVSQTFPDSYYITAEIAAINVDAKGHCYLELVEKDDATIKAQVRAAIWSSRYKAIAREFQTVTARTPSKGMKILIEANLTYHERYGLSLNIVKIDPSYTLGDMARKRQEIIDRLSREGLTDRNKALVMPQVPQRIAVISSLKAAGYDDFTKHLRTNSFGYSFRVNLFAAIMQGDAAEDSIVGALLACEAARDGIDVAVIVRGGGGAADLDCFDSYAIGRQIAMMSMPVISGIGHERDRTVVDVVAHMTVKTPTAAAAFLIERLRAFEEKVESLAKALKGAAGAVVLKNKYALNNYVKVVYGSGRLISRHMGVVTSMTDRLRLLLNRDVKDIRRRTNDLFTRTTTLMFSARRYIVRQGERLKVLNDSITHLNPENILKRGYSITSVNGKVLKSADAVKTGDVLSTQLMQGVIYSTVRPKARIRVIDDKPKEVKDEGRKDLFSGY
ncbi:exodeoxyribonuclease VII large subunit [Candidatus Magnetobacterium casense]|uniref:Exodeoxyribonuclease 7 large subunit n=1 Tax=Candidatus Magnetobacterium casense TaxID=1455061 RepID=A0ABS6RUK9_9BACT|nr:exodeoxyribonuclease VII large subunit [Candidatus Magnetobacterium casensis]MBV6340304.1 exodeoxyribonuclease VII large subunit [Candidatus Magnetobacterium casensis]